MAQRGNPSAFLTLGIGASGVLGSAIYRAFGKTNHSVTGLAHTRTQGRLKQLDLTDQVTVQQFLRELKPDWVIHCAAERRPDVAEKVFLFVTTPPKPANYSQLNAEVPGYLASLAADLGFTLIYISTDYVFDGISPPYGLESPPNPLQLYGRTKRDGETAVSSVAGAKVVILRVPVLYGPAPQNSDSAVNILLDIVQDQSGKQYQMDHYATRYPTNVEDIAGFLVRAIAQDKPLPKIVHYSGDEPFTKYEMCLIFAKILRISHSHIIPDSNPTTGAGATTRPRDCHLSTKETEDLGIEGGLGLSLFEEWWSKYLKAQ
ncbi:Methionine adenosyltransferase 2 subunit beta [Leucoagaricus sp. SymC.cos]|nr:Methionine adenosyltransferase 2 subunit beta [Leucoagaricus sp. SymC.cos]